tara:strand:+ start:303 stop:572 length:270 start_codon:yes stop_codon:yes gene_type:complete
MTIIIGKDKSIVEITKPVVCDGRFISDKSLGKGSTEAEAICDAIIKYKGAENEKIKRQRDKREAFKHARQLRSNAEDRGRISERTSLVP